MSPRVLGELKAMGPWPCIVSRLTCFGPSIDVLVSRWLTMVPEPTVDGCVFIAGGIASLSASLEEEIDPDARMVHTRKRLTCYGNLSLKVCGTDIVP